MSNEIYMINQDDLQFAYRAVKHLLGKDFPVRDIQRECQCVGDVTKIYDEMILDLPDAFKHELYNTIFDHISSALITPVMDDASVIMSLRDEPIGDRFLFAIRITDDYMELTKENLALYDVIVEDIELDVFKLALFYQSYPTADTIPQL